jgi:hypothetical protein
MSLQNHTISNWARLLIAWEKHGGAGLTLPFLAGARTISDPAFMPSRMDTKQLVEEIFREGIPGRAICINWCALTKAYGFCIGNGEASGGIYLPTPATIFAIDLVCEEFGPSPEEIIDGLCGLYAVEISNRTYSITSGHWKEYDDFDRSFIRNATVRC